MNFKPCDICKRMLEHIQSQLEGSFSSAVLFSGKFMNGSVCKATENEIGKNFCIQRFIIKLAEEEK